MNLFYLAELDSNTKHIRFDKDESRHLSKVLRKKAGETIHLTNGQGLLATVELTLIDPKHTEGIVQDSRFEAAPNAQLHVAIAPTKMNDRFEWFLEKATELGISRITPLICEHSERRTIKEERLERILIGAMKQSLRLHLPQLDPLTTFEDWIQDLPNTDDKWVAHCDSGDKMLLKVAIKPDRSCIVLIGPEGDFSYKEVQHALDQGFNSLSLGHNRLRTETAGIAVTAAFSCVNQR